MGLVFSLTTYGYYTRFTNSAPVDFFHFIATTTPQWLTWAPFSFLVFAASDRFPLDRGPRLRNGLIHVGILLLWIPVHLTVDFTYQAWMNDATANMLNFKTLQGFLFRKLYLYILLYPALVVVQHARRYYRRAIDQAVQASRLQEQLTQAQLQTLRVQLQPHFLFNTLHGVSSLMYEDIEAADEMLTNLSDYLRATLGETSTPVVTLEQELDLLDLYLSIEAIRFRDRLKVTKDVAAHALDCSIPIFLLQPLVENAIRHGIERKRGKRHLRIGCHCEGERLVVTVADDGAGLADNYREGTGIGNSRARLALLYGDAAGLTLERLPGEGTQTRVWLPAMPVKGASS